MAKNTKNSLWIRMKNRGVIGYIRDIKRKVRERKQIEHIVQSSNALREHYTLDNAKKDISDSKMVIVMVDDKFKIGLSDRLQGAAFAYSCIRELREEGVDVEFKINFTTPFNLSTYLEPASYNWQIASDEISYNSLQAHELVLMYPDKDKVPHRDISLTNAEYLKREIKNSPHSQIHIYTNIHYDKNKAHSTSFNELFKPSDRLQEALTPHQEVLNNGGKGYISASFRFMDILGDLSTDRKGLTLDKEGQEDIIKRCIEQLEILHQSEPEKMILVASDSNNFLNRVQAELPYAYIVEGEVAHVGLTNDDSFELHLKTFIDYLLIADAEKIYLMRTGKMYGSGFPRTAAMINNRPFEKIEF